MASKRGPKETTDESIPADNSQGVYFPATQMELCEFAVEFRRRVQGSLWLRADKITVGDLVRLKEIEDETEKRAEGKRPTELRVVWINKKNETST